MRIAFITPTLELGGAERSLVKAVEAMQEFTERIEVIVLSDTNCALVSEFPSGTIIHFLRSSTSANPMLWFRVRCLLVKIRPQVVVGWSTYANFVTIMATRFSDKWRIVISERNYVPQINSNKQSGKLRRYLILNLIRALYKKAHVITANSFNNVRFLAKFVGRGPLYVLLPNSIDVDRTSYLAKVPPEIEPPVFEGPHILALGRLQPQKGFDILLEALALVRRQHPWNLLLVGDGPEKERLRTMARTLNMDQAVRWIHAVKNPFPYYQWADLVVLPSRFEGFPNVALEAMACGRVVICSDCKTGPKELTLNGRYGVLVNPEDAQSLATAIIQWGQAADERGRMGALARGHIRASYNISDVKKVFARALCLNV